MKAYIKDGKVLATHADDQAVDYGPGVSVVAVAENAVSPGDPAPAMTASILAASIAGKRRAVLDGGCSVTLGATQVPTWTDAASQGALTALMLAASLNPAIQTAWKGRDGAFYALDAAGIQSLATGVMTFVQSAFAVEAACLGLVASGSLTTLEAINTAPWPANT